MGKTWKWISLILLLLMGFWLVRTLGWENLTPKQIQPFILSFGVWAPLFYIFLYAVRPLFFFPAVVLTLSGGLTFGPWWGTLYDLIGASLGAGLAFGLSRTLGRETVQRWLGKRLKLLDERAERYGFRTVLLLRLIPLIPFDVISYSAGLSRIRFRDYGPATTLGMIPGAFAYNYLGHSLHQVFSTTFYVALGFVVLLMILPVVYKRWKGSSFRSREQGGSK
ncbi:putative membrane protein YdjX (TVP38/TMEM64 family) [Melghirimyces profundicolus]|uniref:TVP38/TMEM64 family membrane protein n=1 Tax=Melghirimyces profundicolus TaxID=1242148 RepID=A0A2T6C8S2_9BACL|nr:TVP38/TMEM64 family protein [Melghirimyces profundicolus]PTX64724.1 putative membrane protein YdjX (TVP38/TMEM64 family) [Melghirimyces profundicolus]